MGAGGLAKYCPWWFKPDDNSEPTSQHEQLVKKKSRVSDMMKSVEILNVHPAKPEHSWKGDVTMYQPQPIMSLPDIYTDENVKARRSSLNRGVVWEKSTRKLRKGGPQVYQKHRRPDISHCQKLSKEQFAMVSKLHQKSQPFSWSSNSSTALTNHAIVGERPKSLSLNDIYHTLEREEAPGKRKLFADDYDSAYVELSPGILCFSVAYYKDQKKVLLNLYSVENVSPKGAKNETIRAVIKCTLVPGGPTKATKVLCNNVNARINQEISFRLRSHPNQYIRISLFDSKFQKKAKDALGHFILPVVALQAGVSNVSHGNFGSRMTMQATSAELLVSLLYMQQDSQLSIMVEKARNLPSPPDKSGKMSTYVKTSIYYRGEKLKTKKTGVISDLLTPLYRTTFTFHVKETQIDELRARLTIKMRSLMNDVSLGTVVLGPCYMSESTLTPWGRLFVKKELVSQWFSCFDSEV